jgi:hypothetical protein
LTTDVVRESRAERGHRYRCTIAHQVDDVHRRSYSPETNSHQ